MTPYKNPKKQREYQASRKNTVRRDWLREQACTLCGQRTNLRVFKHTGTPHLSWSLKGPSHDKFCVMCGDTIACLERRGEKPEPKQEQKRKQRPKQPPSVPTGDVEKPTLSRLAKELSKLDRRSVCPEHGPKDAVLFNGRARFVCCAREVE